MGQTAKDQMNAIIKHIHKCRERALKHFTNQQKIKVTTTNIYKSLIKSYIILEKVVSKYTDENEETTRTITRKLIDFITTSVGSDSTGIFMDWKHELQNYQLYITRRPVKNGGCEAKEHITYTTNAEGKMLQVKSLKSKNNNCAFAMFTNQLKQKIQPDIIRKQLAIPLNTHISLMQLDKLVDHFKCDIRIYDNNIRIIKDTNKYDRKIEGYIHDDHYFVVMKHLQDSKYEICKECGKEIKTKRHRCIIDDVKKNIKMDDNIILWDDQYNNVLEMMKKGLNIIITGGGGVGKSYMLRKLQDHYNILYSASTGTAALNINGVTIDNLLYLNINNEDLLITILLKTNKLKIIEQHDYICIDEISMIDGEKFDRIIQRIRFFNKLIGKEIKLIMCGDCLQLPPVEGRDYGYFFNGGEYEDIHKHSYICRLKEVKRQDNKKFIELLERVRICKHTKEDIKYIKEMKNNKVNEYEATYMCAKNKDVDEINNKYFEFNKNESVTFENRITYLCNYKNIEELPKTNKIVRDVLKRGEDVTLKINMKIMVTENIDVSNGICNGTTGYITAIDNKKVNIKTQDKNVCIEYFKIKSEDHKLDDSNNNYSVINEYMPLKQCNAITIHKSQGATLDKIILNCEGIFENSMFYTAISRIKDPINMKIINFKESYIKCNISAWEYEINRSFLSYFEKMLIDNDNDKLNTLKIKSQDNILKENTIIYDFECAVKEKEGHYPYYNHMIKLFKGKEDETKTLQHYVNSNDVKIDTFNYVMEKVTKQCDQYKKAKDDDNKQMMNYMKCPLYLCGFNSANYDLYFFINQLLKSKYAKRYTSKTVFKGGTLIFFMLIDNESNKIALKTHDLYQILLCSLDDACKSYLGEELKGVFPHKMIGNLFFKDKNILNKSFDLIKDDFFKRDHEKIKHMNLQNYNIGIELEKYAKNDTVITLKLYEKINELCHSILKTDILRMLTAGMMANYGLMKNLPKECFYIDKRRQNRNIKSRLYLCDKKENDIISGSIYGGRVLPRIHSFKSNDVHKDYNSIKDYLVFLDISGMYVNIMYNNEFPYDKATYASKIELDQFNKLIKENKYDELLKVLPNFYICIADCQPNEHDLEPPIGRHENKKLLWDCKRRTEAYTSIDINLLLKNRGHLFEITKLIKWDKSCKVFQKWMKYTLDLKEEGEKQGSEAKRNFGKLMGNSAYGQTLMNIHDDNIQFINNIKDKNDFLENNDLNDIILNDETFEESYHIFIGKKKSDETKDLTSRSRFLGAFVLSYSRLMLDNIVNCVYGEDRFRSEGIQKQIYYGDTDSLIVHQSQLKQLEDNGFIGTENGKLTDDLNKKFINNGIYCKIIQLCAPASKRYAIKYIMPDGTIKEKIKMMGISQNNMNFTDPFSKDKTDKMTYDKFEEMYINKSKHDCKFILNDKLKKINFKRTNEEKINKTPLFSIHKTQIERTLYNTEWSGRKLFEGCYTVPHYWTK